MACYPENEEASAEVDRPVAIAGTFERKRQFHIRMSVYDRMEQAARFGRWNGHQVTPKCDDPVKATARTGHPKLVRDLFGELFGKNEEAK